MLRTIIKREILANITSIRFVITLLLLTTVFIVSGFVFTSKYNQEIGDFTTETNKNLSGLNEKTGNLSGVAYYVQTIHKQPRLTQLFCEGFENSLPNTFKLDVFSIQNPEVVGRANFLFPRFADIDWVFIISMILSFVALLLTFDSFSHEKERRTLSLVMSNSIPRDTVVLGKYISSILILMIPLFVGLLLNIIIVSLSGFSQSVNEWLKIILFVGISLLYLSVFLLMGIMVSSRCAKSSTSIVVLLFIWVVAVIIIPSCGRIFSEKFVSVPSRPEVDRNIEEARREIWDNAERYGKNAGNWTSADPHADWVNPPARTRLLGALSDSRNRINEDYANRMIAQVTYGRNITKISPATLYQCASEALFGTGVSRFGSLYDQVKRYRETLKSHLIDEDNKDPESWHLLAEGSPPGILLSQKPVDYNAIPKFVESNPSVTEVSRNALWDILALVLINIVLFMAAYVSFLRCDVR
ncbi:ABC transporter permease [Candidatus Latescibacterota bacterium]